jgi:hypothetical protein
LPVARQSKIIPRCDRTDDGQIPKIPTQIPRVAPLGRALQIALGQINLAGVPNNGPQRLSLGHLKHLCADGDDQHRFVIEIARAGRNDNMRRVVASNAKYAVHCENLHSNHDHSYRQMHPFTVMRPERSPVTAAAPWALAIRHGYAMTLYRCRKNTERPMSAPAYRRYAIYYTLPPGPLARFGADWLGWDIAEGRSSAQRPDIPGLPASINALTETPRRYGFHATIKPPFRLAPHQSEAALTAALSSFCATRPPACAAGLELARLGRFLALVPVGDARDLTTLAADVVRDFDGFRATPTATEIARHDSPALGAAQTENLHRWGYPHVMDSFRWHMTLTGKHPRADAARTHAALTSVVTPFLPHPFTLGALSLAGEDSTGHFHLIQRISLAG